MAYHNNPRIVTDGLVLCLDANSKRSYPGSGVTWYDLSGNGYNAVSQASAATTESKFNSAGYFDLDESSDIYFLISGLNNYNFGSNVSIEFWIKNTGGDYRAIIQNSGSGSSDDSIDIRFGREDYYGGANNGTNCIFILNSSATYLFFYVPLNVWTHVCCTHDGSTMRAYTNGSLFNSTSYSGAISQSAYDMKLFRHYNTAEDLVNPFSSLKIYNRTLSLTEIQQNYNAIKGRFGL